MICFLCPRCRTRRSRAAKAPVVERTLAARAASIRAARSQRLASPAGAMLARALVVAGAVAGPAGRVLGGGEDAHVRAELGDQDLGGALVHAADGVEARELLGEGRHGAIDLGAHGLDGLVQVVEVGEELADEEGVVGAEVAEQGVSQGGQLLAQLAAGEIREDNGVGGAGHQGLEHGPPGGAEQTRGDRGELDPGVFEDLVEAVGVACALLDKEFPVAGEPRFIVPLLRKCRES
jgi:hypothetical protein